MLGKEHPKPNVFGELLQKKVLQGCHGHYFKQYVLFSMALRSNQQKGYETAWMDRLEIRLRCI